jgi:hypothetical protein
MRPAGLIWVVVLASCHIGAFEHVNSVYVEPTTGYSVEANWRYNRAGNVWPLQFGDVAEPGPLNPRVIEFVFAADDSPVARYYDLMLSLPQRPPRVAADLAALRHEMGSAASASPAPTGRDYARALARKLAAHINGALGAGSAGVLWGIPVDLDAGIPLLEYEHEGIRTMQTTLLRYESVGLLVMHSSAMQEVLVWDLGDLPGAFRASPPLDQATVDAHIVALHPAAQ